MPDPNLKFLPISKSIAPTIDKSNIDTWTKYILPHPTPFWEFWKKDEEFKYPYISLATIYKEEGLIKPELLVVNDGIDYEDALAHLRVLATPNVWLLHDVVGIRAISYLLYLWFTESGVKSELSRLLGSHNE